MSFSKESNITKARRLTFNYKDTEIKLISQYKIEKILPSSSTLSKGKDKSGVWYEITDDNQNIIYSRGIPNAIQTDFEVFSNETEKESISRQKAPQIEGTFSILIPGVPEAKTLSIFSNPIEKGEKLLQKSSTKIFEMNLNGDTMK